MDKKLNVLISIGVLLVLVTAFLFATGAITKLTGKAVYSGDIEGFVKCLSGNNVKMYGAYWCGHCQNQKAMFPGDILIDNNIYVECDPRGTNPQDELCIEKGIQGYPTWEINGKFYPGELDFERIAELSGCKLN